MGKQIKVKAKISAGTHRIHGEIIKGKEYLIDEDHFAPQLFKRVKEKTDQKD